MKLQNNLVDSFVKKPDINKYKAALIYGPDLGQVTLRRKELVRSLLSTNDDSLSLLEIPYQKIKDNPSLLADEVGSVTLFGGSKVIVISQAGATVDSIIIEIVAAIKPSNPNFVIFEAGDLTPTSSLRKAFDFTANLVSIACYKDDIYVIASFVRNSLTQGGYRFDNDVPNVIASRCQGDRLVVTSELEKLYCYMGDERHIGLEDIDAIIIDNSENSFDSLCNAVGLKDAKRINIELNKFFAEGESPVAIVTVLSRHFLRLHQVKTKIASGSPIDSALATLSPQLFFKQVDIFKRQLQLWSEKGMLKILNMLLDLEAKCKSTSIPAEVVCSRLLNLAVTVK